MISTVNIGGYMNKKVIILLMISMILLLTSCSMGTGSNTSVRQGIEINDISSSIGAVGEDTKEFETQSFKYTLTLTNNEPEDMKIISVNPELSDKFLERVKNKDTEIKVNKIISKEGSLEVSGEIIFDAKGLTKEQILSLEPFIKNIKITEERTINKEF